MATANLVKIRPWLPPIFSDLTIECQGVSWHVHRVTVSQGCPFFLKACSNPFLERINRTIRLPEDDPEAVDGLLMFLYTTRVRPIIVSKDPAETKQSFSTTIALFGLADKYGVVKLKEKLAANMRDAVADSNLQACSIDLVPEVYSLHEIGHAELREPVVLAVQHEIWSLFESHKVDTLKQALKLPDFAFDLVRKLTDLDNAGQGDPSLRAVAPPQVYCETCESVCPTEVLCRCGVCYNNDVRMASKNDVVSKSIRRERAKQARLRARTEAMLKRTLDSKLCS